MSTSFKPGQNVKCTVIKTPTNRASRVTVERLMRMDPSVKRGLRKAHHKRQQNLDVYNRGNRDWTNRAICAKMVKAVTGQSWTMPFTLDLTDEFAAVAKFVKIEKA